MLQDGMVDGPKESFRIQLGIVSFGGMTGGNSRTARRRARFAGRFSMIGLFLALYGHRVAQGFSHRHRHPARPNSGEAVSVAFVQPNPVALQAENLISV